MRLTSARLVMAGLVFVVAYYGLVLLHAPDPVMEVAALAPAALALVTHVHAARRRSGRAAVYWRLTALGILVWMAGAVLSALVVRAGGPGSGTLPAGLARVSDGLFLGFLVPMLVAVALRPHPRVNERDAVTLADAGLVAAAVTFVFVRLLVLPVESLDGRSPAWRQVLGLLAWVLALWSVLLWRRVREPEWRTAYGLTALFAVLYGGLVPLAAHAPRGGPADLAWSGPFLLLALAALPRRPSFRPAALPVALLLAGPAPLAVELLLRALLPALGLPYEPQPRLLLGAAVFLAAGCALRLFLEERAEARHQAEAGAFLEETRRATRLSTLANRSVSVVAELEQAAERVVDHAVAATPFLGEQGERVVEQAQRARAIVQEMRKALRPAPQTRTWVDVGALLHESIHASMDEGMPLHVAVSGTNHLPPVWADPSALGTALRHLIRNAAQATPGGTLTVTGRSDGREVRLSFADDGPGIAPEHRGRVFDPFFTTRPTGDGVGLGLTQVHFVAREHGGSVVLEPTARGACFRLRLPARERRRPQPVQAPWPLAAAVFLSALLATVLVVLPTGQLRLTWSVSFQAASAVAAAAALFWAARQERGPARRFWMLLATGPALWSLTRLTRILQSGFEGPPVEHTWHLAVYVAIDLLWAAALLFRPDRRTEGGTRPAVVLGYVLAAVVYAHFYAYSFLLPSLYRIQGSRLTMQMVLARGLHRVVLVAWCAILALRTVSPYWRLVYVRLSFVLGLWAAGQTLAAFNRWQGGYQDGALSDLGWIVPFLLLGALALTEALRSRAGLTVVPAPGLSRAFRTASALLVLAAIPALAALMPSSGVPALDAAREWITRASVVAFALALAAREILLDRPRLPQRAPGEAGARALGLGSAAPQMLRTVLSALHEVSGHVSAIAALARLPVAPGGGGGRSLADAARVEERAGAAARIVRNLVGALRESGGTAELVSLDVLVREVVERRRPELQAEGVRLETRLFPSLPRLWLEVAAVRQVILTSVDVAALSLRRGSGGGTIEVVTSLEEDDVALIVRHGGPGLPASVLRQLSRSPLAGPSSRDEDLALALGWEAAAQHGGELLARNPRQGGGELTLRLPRALAEGPARPLPRAEASS